jgi:hypothetical protein
MTRIVITAATVVGLLGGATSSWAQSAAPAPHAASAPPQTFDAKSGAPNADALLLVDFKKRIDAYLKLRDAAKKGLPPLKETDDPAHIKHAQDSLGETIRVVRADAKQGDIFTPDIVAHFRRLLKPALKTENGQKAKEVLKDDAPAPEKINFEVNAKYPSSATLPTVPSAVLLNLPPLPKSLEYRIVGKALLLRDVDADIIVDFFPNAIP